MVREEATVRLCVGVGCALVSAAFLVHVAAAQDPIEGRWEGTVQSERGTRPAAATFTRSGTTYTGAISGLQPDSLLQLEGIRIDGDTVTAVARRESPLGTVQVKYVLSLRGETLTGRGHAEIGGQIVDFTLDLKRMSAASADAAAPGASPRTRPARPPVPPPLQKQSLEYFVGQWNVRSLARESPLGSAGSRNGTVAFARAAAGNFLEGLSEGQSDEGKYQERVLLGFDDGKKVLVAFERRAGGIDLLGLGDWTAPMTIRLDVSPVRIRGQTIRLKRTYAVLSANAFRITEDFSIDGGPFERLSDATYTKVQTPAAKE